MNEKKYRCYFCKYHEIEHDVFRAQGDDHISERWVCNYRDDEMCVPGCDEFRPKRAS